MDRPNYVKDFNKPPSTEIKHISGHWYLYEYSHARDPHSGKWKKKSGRCLGRITEQGLVASRRAPTTSRDLEAGDILEVGATQLCWNRTAEMRELLAGLFPTMWRQIYVIAILRALGYTEFRLIQSAYQDSILSVRFPGLALSGASITRLLQDLGRKRSLIQRYLEAQMPGPGSSYLLIDGHRLLSYSKGLQLARIGYDSKHRYHPQLNLMYLFETSAGVGRPVYYEQFSGDIVDVTAFGDIIEHAGILKEQCMVVADKGCVSGPLLDKLNDQGILYCVALKRDNSFVAGNIPTRDRFPEVFMYEGRAIRAKTFKWGDFNIHLFLDGGLYESELSDLTERIKKSNAAKEQQAEAEIKRRRKGKGKLTDEELTSLQTARNVAKAAAEKREMGTITLRTNAIGRTAEECYRIYKQRQAIEGFFKVYDCTLNFNASYMRDVRSEEGWLFLNHLSASICIDIIDEIACTGESKDLSWNMLRESLKRVFAIRGTSGNWRPIPVKRATQELCKHVGLDVVNMSILDECNNI